MVILKCNNKYWRAHVLPNNLDGWYVIVENSDIGKTSIVDKTHQLIIFDQSQVCYIKEKYMTEWAFDRFVAYNGEEISCSPDMNEGQKGVRLRGGGFVIKDGKKVYYQKFFIGTENQAIKTNPNKYEELIKRSLGTERHTPTNSEGHANPLKTKPEQLLDD